jgi:carbamoyl-phosphate synthase large subunit
MADEVNILLTCVGRRVSLLEAFRKALADLGLKGRVYGADHSRLAAAFHRADEGFVVPSAREGEPYVEALAAICEQRQVALLVPLLDWELEVLADGRERLERAGTRALISSPQVVRICRDKVETFEFLKAHGFDTPEVLPYADALAAPYPLFMKPRYGSSAKDVRKIPDRGALEFFQKAATEETVIQEFVDGREHTVDVYAGLDGVPRVAVPRRRLKVRGGEVVKAVTVRHGEIIRRSMLLVEALEACVGVITLQCFLTADDRVRFIEINPRFGGGVPLTIRAGADFPRWLIEEHLGRRPEIDPQAWKDRLVMLRYDEAVFRPAGDVEDLSDRSEAGR